MFRSILILSHFYFLWLTISELKQDAALWAQIDRNPWACGFCKLINMAIGTGGNVHKSTHKPVHWWSFFCNWMFFSKAELGISIESRINIFGWFVHLPGCQILYRFYTKSILFLVSFPHMRFWVHIDESTRFPANVFTQCSDQQTRVMRNLNIVEERSKIFIWIWLFKCFMWKNNEFAGCVFSPLMHKMCIHG